MEERRSSKRVGFQLKTALTPEKGGPIELLRANIAWGGIGGYTRDSIDEGIKIRTEFFFTLRSGQVLSEKLPGKIAWTHRDGNFNAFGIAFSELDPAAHPRLISYLQYIDQAG